MRGRREKRDRKKIKRCFKESAGIFLMSNREEKDIKENRKQRTSTLDSAVSTSPLLKDSKWLDVSVGTLIVL